MLSENNLTPLRKFSKRHAAVPRLALLLLPDRGSISPLVRRAGFLLVVLMLPVALISGCSGGGVLTEGGWVFEGDDVIRVQPRRAQTQEEALGRVVRTIEQSPFKLDTLSRTSGYARTRAQPLNGTSDRADAPVVRLNVVVTDSATVEVAGQVTALQSPDGEPSPSREWARVAWRQGVQTGATPWGVMQDFAQLIGNIQGYEEDPRGLDSFACGGRRCEQGHVCQHNVCRDEKWQPTVASDAQPPSADEHATAGTNRPVINQAIIEYSNRERTNRGLAPLTPDTTLTRIACRHNQDMIADGYFDHEDSDGREPSDRVNREHRRLIGTVGENIRVGGAVEEGSSRRDRREIGKASVEGWMDSPGHRRNILKTRYTHIGACYTDHDRGRGTQLFATVYAYLDQPLPRTMTPGDSLSTSVTPTKVPGEAIRYVFFSPDETDQKTLGRAFDEEAALPLDGTLHVPKQPGRYELRVFFQLEDGVTFRSGPHVEIGER